MGAAHTTSARFTLLQKSTAAGAWRSGTQPSKPSPSVSVAVPAAKITREDRALFIRPVCELFWLQTRAARTQLRNLSFEGWWYLCLAREVLLESAQRSVPPRTRGFGMK